MSPAAVEDCSSVFCFQVVRNQGKNGCSICRRVPQMAFHVFSCCTSFFLLLQLPAVCVTCGGSHVVRQKQPLSLTSPNYGLGPYPHRSNCVWQVTADGNQVRLCLLVWTERVTAKTFVSVCVCLSVYNNQSQCFSRAFQQNLFLRFPSDIHKNIK